MSDVEKSQSQKENMTLEAKDAPLKENEYTNGKQNVDFPMSDVTYDNIKEELLNHVARSKAIFKSQQKGEPELTFDEKHAIGGKLLERSHCLFLSKFGHYLKLEHLKYFSKSEDYETVYHVNRLQRYFNNSTRHIDVRNRRYEALKALIEKGEYFSECEMMKRNPLLYEHLVGQYLTEEERKARDSIDARSANYVDILMEAVERNRLEKRLRSQQEEEDEVREENDSDEDDGDSNKGSIISETTDFDKPSVQWGENLNKTRNDKNKERKIQYKISIQEIQLLRQEFVTNMYQSFLDGKDKDFDYRYIYCANQLY